MRLNVGTFLLLLTIYLICYWRFGHKQRQFPSLPITMRGPFQHKPSFRVWAARGKQTLFWLALLFLVFALSNPRLVEEIASQQQLAKSDLPRSGVAIYFLLDESGSMQETVHTIDEHGRSIEIPKVDLAKQAILEFVDGAKGLNLPGRKDDLVGLIGFARIPQVLCPLTLNRAEIAAALRPITPIQEDERNGTAIGYAIFKAVNIIVATKHFAKRQQEEHKSVYSVTNQAVIIITDGLQSPNPADINNPFRFMPPEEAIRYAKDNGIRVYYIGIDPVLKGSEYADDVKSMREALRGSGGELFISDPNQPIEDILSQVDQMEKSEISPETVVTVKPTKESTLVFFFIASCLACLAAGQFIETVVARSTP